MKILIACEYSGVVRRAFQAKGHDVTSCDLLPSDDDSPCHFQGDIFECLKDCDSFDMMVAHPPCTFLCSSGLHWNKKRPERVLETEKAVKFVEKLMKVKIRKKAFENPVGCLSSRIRKPNQYIQPWQFGHDASKKTGLWLENLPKLSHTNIVCPKGWSRSLSLEDRPDITHKKVDGYWFSIRGLNTKPVWENQTSSGQNKLPPSPDRWKIRSTTYQGISDAMADQWQ